MGHIHVLPPETSRLIAAGEVIDRPASALRELLDNAIDARATDIQVKIEKGGIDLIQVVDNGVGMSRDDLELSIAEHATSKISTADDLLSVSTLGFRGEALASIASVSELEITSREAGAEVGWLLSRPSGRAPGSVQPIRPTAARQGTTVRVQALFSQYPARRQFLKRPMSEALLCHAIFVERALAFPDIGFSWSSAGSTENYPPGSLEQRFGLLYPEVPPATVFRFDDSTGEGAFTLLFADPSFHRKDRRYLQIFVNRRKVPEWGLSSILEYAFSGYLPGGMKPCAFLFASIAPELVDFNIHPAKREVRIKNSEAFKSAVYASVQPHLRSIFGAGPSNMDRSRAASQEFFYAPGSGEARGGAPEKAFFVSENPGSGGRQNAQEDQRNARRFPGCDAAPGFWDALQAERLAGSPRTDAWTEAMRGDSARDSIPSASPYDTPFGAPPGGASGASPEVPGASRGSFRYIGRAFGPFLLFEKDDVLYILDQHAAHERILYDALKESQHPSQALLVPYVLEFPSDEARARFGKSREDLERVGFRFDLDGDSCVINEVPALLGEAKAVQSLRDLFFSDPSGAPELTGRGPQADLLATVACRAAVKDGDLLDPDAANNLIEQALRLPFPRCPHGRPIWVALDRNSLYRMVGRLLG